MKAHRVIVIGAGASGMMAAGRAGEVGADVLLLEKTSSPGNKLLITGGSRCNLTNAMDLDRFIDMFGANGRFLPSAFSRFFRDELISLLARYKVEVKEEAGGRVFPASGDSNDVLGALQCYMFDNGVKLRTGCGVTRILMRERGVSGVVAGGETVDCSAVVLASGGATYSATGSSGDGYRLAATLGHTIVPVRPALVPLVVKDLRRAADMQGVAFRESRLTAFRCHAAEIDPTVAVTRDYGRGAGPGKPRHGTIESRRGDIMMTHFGLGGPATLLVSLAVVDALKEGPVSVAIDVFPDLSLEDLGQHMQREFDRHGKQVLRNLLQRLLPPKSVSPLAEAASVSLDRTCSKVSAAERDSLAQWLKCLRFDIERPLSMDAAFVTAGGVSLKEIDPRTMASRLEQGLYFCGEVMDLDADTGGFNLQAAFSTGYVAGESAAITT